MNRLVVNKQLLMFLLITNYVNLAQMINTDFLLCCLLFDIPVVRLFKLYTTITNCVIC